MTPKYTPGPWNIYAHPITSKADAILELIEQVQSTEPIATHLYLINAAGKCPAVAGCGPTSEANARLIAAAPDLLEALKLCRSALGTAQHEIQDTARNSVIGRRIATATAAITKAEGAQ